MNRFFEWCDEQLVDLGVMIAAFCRGFAEGMRK